MWCRQEQSRTGPRCPAPRIWSIHKNQMGPEKWPAWCWFSSKLVHVLSLPLGIPSVRVSPGLIAECFFGWLDYWCFPKTIFSASQVKLQIWSHLWKFLLNSMLASFSCSSWTLLGICVKIRLSRFATQWIIFRPDSWSTFFYNLIVFYLWILVYSSISLSMVCLGSWATEPPW